MKNNEIITNADNPDANKVRFAINVISKMQSELQECIERGYGPFMAAIYRGKTLIAKSANTVVQDRCSNHHAEVNTIRAAQQKLKKYDLSNDDISLFITAEPCMMCVGAIMWSGIKNVYYGVPSKLVEKLTGFDEGFKRNWMGEFKKRGITVYGNICADAGADVLRQYMKYGKEFYGPKNK